MEAKASLRRAALARRAAMTAEERRRAGIALATALGPLVGAARRVAAYVALPTEPATAALLSARPDALLPVLLPDGDLDWATGPDLVPGLGALPQPTGRRRGVDALATCDLVLVPALAVDLRGTRLGRGGGSYDRALARTGAQVVALLYDGELVEALPAEPHDRPVTDAVTPGGGLVRLG